MFKGVGGQSRPRLLRQGMCVLGGKKVLYLPDTHGIPASALSVCSFGQNERAAMQLPKASVLHNQASFCVKESFSFKIRQILFQLTVLSRGNPASSASA